MKQAIIFILAAIVIGFVIFAVMFWIAKTEFQFAVNAALSGALGGLTAELAKRWWEKKKKRRLSANK